MVIKMDRIELIIDGQKIECTPTNLGLTNKIYKGIFDDEVVAIRIPKEETKELSTFDNEHMVLPLIKELNLDANELYYDPSTRIRITKWINNASEYKDCFDDNKIIRAAKLIRKLHDAKIITHNEFNCISLLREYQSKIQASLFPLEKYYYLIDKVKQIHNPHILCHNDLVSGNLLFTDSKDYLIDYEYAKDNDPLFDIMSFLTENNITDLNKRQLFYQTYFETTLTDKVKHELSVYESFHNLLWCTWATMMFDLLHENIYKEIATDKYNALQANEKIEESI